MVEQSAGIGVPVSSSPGLAELFGMAQGDSKLLQLLAQQFGNGKSQAPVQKPLSLPAWRPGQYRKMRADSRV